VKIIIQTGSLSVSGQNEPWAIGMDDKLILRQQFVINYISPFCFLADKKMFKQVYVIW